MVGMKIVAVGTDAKGNINIEELRKAAEANKDNLAALMVLLLFDIYSIISMSVCLAILLPVAF